MAERKQDLLGNVIGKITELPGAKGLIDSMHTMRERMDELQRRVRGLEQLEKRVKDLEKRVKALEAGGATTRSTSRARKPSSTGTGTAASTKPSEAAPSTAPPRTTPPTSSGSS